MLRWIKKKFEIEPAAEKSIAPSADLPIESTASLKSRQSENSQVFIPVDQKEPLFRGSLPDDFWTVLMFYPYTVESCRLDEIRRTPEYALAKKKYEQSLKETSAQHDRDNIVSNTSTELQLQLQSDTTQTSRRPL